MEKKLKRLNKIPKIVKLDLTGCESLLEIHERIRKAFDFPDWYGKNWDAFWDLLSFECDADKVEIFGEYTLSHKFDKYLKMIHKILDRMVKTCAKWGELFEYEIIN